MLQIIMFLSNSFGIQRGSLSTVATGCLNRVVEFRKRVVGQDERKDRIDFVLRLTSRQRRTVAALFGCVVIQSCINSTASIHRLIYPPCANQAYTSSANTYGMKLATQCSNAVVGYTS